MDQWVPWRQVRMSLGVTAGLYLGVVIYSRFESYPRPGAVDWLANQI